MGEKGQLPELWIYEQHGTELAEVRSLAAGKRAPVADGHRVAARVADDWAAQKRAAGEVWAPAAALTGLGDGLRRLS